MIENKLQKFIELYKKAVINNTQYEYIDLLEEMWYNFSDEEQKQINILIEEYDVISTNSNRTLDC